MRGRRRRADRVDFFEARPGFRTSRRSLFSCDFGRLVTSLQQQDVSAAFGVPQETCTLGEVAKLSGRSTKVVGGWLRAAGVPLHGSTSGRHFYVKHLSARLPELYDLLVERAEKRARGEHVPTHIGRRERIEAALPRPP